MRRRDCAGPLVALFAGIRAGLAAPAAVLGFSGYEWEIKQSGGRVGPGPNRFSAKNVAVEPDGALRLRIAPDNGEWACAEVISRKSFGYGTYRFFVRDTSDLDLNSILGLFTWDTAAKAQAYRENDIEVGRWGDASSENCQFVVQPANRSDHVIRFEVPPGPVLHEFSWAPSEVRFRSVAGFDASAESKVIRRHTFTDGIPPAGGENARMNLWLLGGHNPRTGKPVDVVVEAFKFLPLP
jgi:hypothetical protein